MSEGRHEKVPKRDPRRGKRFERPAATSKHKRRRSYD
jgi:hypothetical protein